MIFIDSNIKPYLLMNFTCFVCLRRYESGVLLRFAATFLTGTTIFLGSAFLLFRHLEITLMLELLFDLFLHIIGLLHMWLTEVSLESLLALPWLLMLFGLHLDGPFVYIIVRSILATYLINGALLGFRRRVWLSFFQCFGNIILQLRLIWQSMRVVG